MYVTRPLSLYKRNPAALSQPLLEGPNSGYLVIFDEAAQTYNCFGCKNSRIKHLPFPQNKNLTVTYSTGENSHDYDKVIFIPVLNHPLSDNLYYVIRRQGKHQGKASTSSKEEDMGTCFCCNYVKDVKPSPMDPYNIYQQFEIIKRSHGFQAKSTASDGFPPEFLRRKGWEVYCKTPDNYNLSEALGVNSELQARLPDFNFPLSNDSSKSVAVGKWYCPFLFVKEGKELKEQMKKSPFYVMRLEQRWDKVFSRENGDSGENSVLVDVFFQTEAAKVAGRDAVWDENQVEDGFLWFESYGGEGTGTRVGLSMAIVERMRWEQERVGWSGGKGRQGRIEKVEEFGGTERWNKFGCYVLVERFVLTRMDGSLVLTYDYKHTHQIRCKWE
ncbi:hypothetical protein L6164_001824 [Bauhinia variegata]|uniref:Uncharacterized protein n=1 Tax=Bauhinia variegata TaxID=167791 RepID=A0ACB9QAQ9_BAUVA|nr:hypothetical protein L6164_001824 [Bauhinia variegata]